MLSRAQIFSLDALIAIGVFVVILASISWSWASLQNRIDIFEERNDMEFIASNAIASLVETPGRPYNWSEEDSGFFSIVNVSSLGLAFPGYPNLLSRANVERLQELNNTCNCPGAAWNDGYYRNISRILGIQGPGYEFYLQFFEANDEGFNSVSYRIGNLPGEAVEQLVVRQRMALLDNWTLVKLEVWK